MAHAPVPEPEKEHTALSSVYLLYRLVKESPKWVRIATVLVLVCAISLSLVGKIQDFFGKTKKEDPSTTATKTQVAVQQVQTPISIQIQNGPYPLPAGSKQVDAPGNANKIPQNLDATLHVDEGTRHSKFHQDHPEDNPKLTVIAKFDEKDDIAYKFYGKTDKCVWVLRHENGVPISQFVEDPAYRDGVPQAPPTTNASSMTNREIENATAISLIDALIPSATAAPLKFPSEGNESPLQPVQAGCANPHPGPYSWWWGPPQDQCWSPMYRQWRDGCTHYQMFNRCANAWDGRIIWTYCNPNHYW